MSMSVVPYATGGRRVLHPRSCAGNGRSISCILAAARVMEVVHGSKVMFSGIRVRTTSMPFNVNSKDNIVFNIANNIARTILHELRRKRGEMSVRSVGGDNIHKSSNVGILACGCGKERVGTTIMGNLTGTSGMLRRVGGRRTRCSFIRIVTYHEKYVVNKNRPIGTKPEAEGTEVGKLCSASMGARVGGSGRGPVVLSLCSALLGKGRRRLLREGFSNGWDV